MGQVSSPTKRLVITSDLAEACRAVQVVMAEVDAHSYDENARFAIRLALDEALSNAVRHGNQGDPRKHVAIEYAVADDRVAITVCDEGPGFHPEALPDPTLDENLERPNGRGVLLMRAYMTEVHYSPRGNCVTLIKNRGCPLPVKPGRP